MAESAYVCLYFGQKDECPNCGGWVHANDEDGNRSPGVETPHGVYCSEDCAADAEVFRARARAAGPVWCPSCGFDNHEHAPDCARAALAREDTADER
jgi:hypothetical protein